MTHYKLRAHDGVYRCEYCIFATPHEGKIKRHVVRKHGVELPPEPPPEFVKPPKTGVEITKAPSKKNSKKGIE